MTEAEAAAIMKLVRSGQLSDDGIELARSMLQLAERYGLSMGISATPLKKDSELAEVYNAINTRTKELNFISPGTGIHYMPAYYQTIMTFIRDGRIGVFLVNKDAEFRKFANGGAVDKVGGLYRSNKNTLFLGSGFSANESAHLIVHEVTHAIQDWRDVNTTNKFAEADAFVAGAVADAVVNTVSLRGNPQDNARLAAKDVLDKTALNRHDKGWNKKYTAIVAEVEKHTDYRAQANMRFRSQEPGEKGSERKVFAKTLAEIEAMDNVLDKIIDKPEDVTDALGKIFAPSSAPAPSPHGTPSR